MEIWDGYPILILGYKVESKFVNYNAARAYAIKMKVKSSKAWKAMKNNLPDNIPNVPDSFYKNKGWVSWFHFLGKDK